MSQSNRGIINSRERKRQNYLLKRAGIYSISGICGLFSSAGFAATALCVLGLLLTLNYGDCDDSPCMSNWQVAGMCAPWIVSGIFVGLGALVGCWKSSSAGAAVPYVPPVREQIAALPAEQILVRGTNGAAATPEELLRAVHNETTTPAEDLLRAAAARNDR